MAVGQLINQSTLKSERVLNLIRKLVLLCLKSNICNKASHIPTKQNSIADSLSCSQLGRFKRLSSKADQQPTPLLIYICET